MTLSRRTLIKGTAAYAATGATPFFVPAVAAAQNVIQDENARTSGVTSGWYITDANYASNREIEGYASATSVARGGSISLYVQTSGADTSYTINVYRVGWYGGVGGRLVAGPFTRSRVAQPAPMVDASTRLVECNWIDPYVLSIPNTGSDWASGVYLAKLTGSVTGKQSYIVFVVRDDARTAAVMFQSSVTTFAAYNNWGGYDFYDTDSIGGIPAVKVSFSRPYSNGQRHMNGKGAGDFFSWEINFLRFLEREGYDVQYSTNIDTHVSPGRLLNRRAFLSIGHDEYYTREMYDAVQSARDAGVNLGFIGANNIYWQIRLEPSSTGQPNRTVVGYKWATDPVQGSTATYLWRETARAPINRPEAGLIGVMYDYNTVDLPMVVADSSGWICAGTGLSTGSVLPGMLGYEVDRLAPSSPAGIQVIMSSPYDVGGERRYSHATYYTAGSGAGVFATGSMNWNWGVDSFSPGPRAGKDDQHEDRSHPAVQQITRNVLNRWVSAGVGGAPTITSVPVTAATAGAAYSYDVNATDPNGDTLTYSLTVAPSGMTINAGSGLISWTPTTAQGGTQNVSVRVADPGGLTATQSFTITVGGGTAPSTTRVDLANPSSVTAAPGSTVNVTLNWYRMPMAANYLQFMHLVNASGQATSVDDHWTTSASWTAGPFSQTRTITVPAGLALGPYDIRVGLSGGNPWVDLPLVAGSGVTDPGADRRYKVATLTVGNGNAGPTITSTAVTAATVGVAYAYDVNATDPNGDTLTYSLTTAPSGMTINASSGLIAWTPGSGQIGSQAVTVRVADPGGLVAAQSFAVVVSAANAGPTITSTAVTTATVGVAYSYDVNASDPNGDTLTYTLPTAPSGMTINPSNGLISWVPAAGQAGNHAVTVRVTDPGSLAATQSFTLVVGGSSAGAPTITSTPIVAATVGVAYSYDVNATDPNGDTLSYSLTTAPSGMTINAVNGLIAWTPTTAQVGDRAVSVRVADPGGLAATQGFTVNVRAANSPPTITSTPVTTAAVGTTYNYLMSATDPNGGPLTYSLTSAPSGMTINASTGLIAWTPTASQAGSNAVTARVADPGGLAATQSFSISVTNGTAPSTTRVDMASPSTYTAARGAVVNITLNWYRMPMAANYLQFMHLQNAAGNQWSVDDHWTTSSTWAAGAFSQTRSITVPATIPSGTYDIRVGLSGGNPWVDLPLVLGTGVTDPGTLRKYKVGTLVVP